MTPERYQQVKEIFYAALDVAPQERTTFLAEACANDQELAREVKSLLASHEGAEDFIETPAAQSITQFETAETDSLIGQKIGHYQVVRELGQGGMGAVYLAVRNDEQYQKRVAIKLIRHGMETDFTRSRFRHERQILASLDHPNIARLVDGGTTEAGLPWLAMEYIEGQEINDYCDQHQLSTIDRLKLFSHVCSAVQFAHQNLVIHRDLKPGNILITADGSPRLLDFGIAKLVNPEASDQTADHTMTGMRLMTPGYASPEQARGETITTASDIYSLGVVLYELLTGHRPYHVSGRSQQEILRIICEEEPSKPSTAVSKPETIPNRDGLTTSILTPEFVSRTRDDQPEKLRRRLSGDLDNIVLMAMRKEPQRRYTSVSQLAEDIHRHLIGLPVLARKDTFSYRAGKFIRRHKVGVAASAVIVLVLLGGITTTIWQARVAHIQRARAEQRFNDVRKLANSFLFELHDAIEKLPGSTPARALLVKRALEYLDSLARESSGDPTLQSELATAYVKVGDIQGNPYSANLGDIKGALESYQKSLQIRQALLTSNPNQSQAKRDLAASHRRVGEVLEQMNDAPGQLQNYRRALEIIESLPAQELLDPQVRREQASIYEGIGDSLKFAGDNIGSLENHRRSLQIVEAVVAQEPDNLIFRRHLAIQLNKVCLRLSATGAKVEGLELSRKSLSLFEALSTAQPNNAQAKRELAVAYNGIGDQFYEAGEVKGELANYSRALKLREEMAAADPVNQQLRRDLATSQGNVGYALAQTGDEAGTIENYSKSVATFEAMSAANPNDALIMRDLAACYDFYGESWKNLATQPSISRGKQITRWKQARSWLERSLKLAVEMKEQGILPGQEVSLITDLKQHLEDCDKGLLKLQATK